MIFTQQNKVATVLEPAANRFNGNPVSSYVDTANYGHVTFLVALGACNTGTVKLQVLAATDAAGDGATAIPFRICKAETSPADSMTDPAYTADANGYTTNAADNTLYAIEVEARELGQGNPFVAVQGTQVAAGAISASIVAIGSNARYMGSNSSEMPSMLS